MDGAEKQVEKALKGYENDKPWDFQESKGLFLTVRDGSDDGFTSPSSSSLEAMVQSRASLPRKRRSVNRPNPWTRED